MTNIATAAVVIAMGIAWAGFTHARTIVLKAEGCSCVMALNNSCHDNYLPNIQNNIIFETIENGRLVISSCDWCQRPVIIDECRLSGSE
jgi:hypothetical protein